MGTHLLRWRYFEVHHNGVTHHRNALVPAGLWHLLKRVYPEEGVLFFERQIDAVKIDRMEWNV